MKRIVMVLLVIAAFFAVPFSAAASESVPQGIMDMRSSIVRVVCDDAENGGFGTGFAIGTGQPIEYIVTNYHVVEADTSRLAVWFGAESFVNAQVAASLPASDLCVLKLEKPIYDMEPLVLNDGGDSVSGEPVYALGFPGSADVFSDTMTANAEDVTVTDGIISSIKSLSLYEGSSPVQLYQINAAINPGNSGGPLVNQRGEVIGINSYTTYDSQGINAAVSIMELIDLLKQNGIEYKTPGLLSSLWMIIIGAAIAVVIVLLVLWKKGIVKIKKSKKGVPLGTYLHLKGGKIPFDMALYILEPVILGLAGMHAKGMCHLDICPENITVDTGTQKAALLQPGKKSQKGYSIVSRPGYSPLEQYKTNGDIGTWTDVYALAAVVFRMVTGQTPPEALERMENDDVLQQGIEERSIDENKKQVWSSALNIAVIGRIRNCMLLGKEWLQKETTETVIDLEKNINKEEYPFAANESANKVKKENRRKYKRIPAYILCAVGIAAAGYFGWVEYNYQKIEEYAGNGYYAQAVDNFSKIPVFYKEAPDLRIYCIAGMWLDDGKFDAAEEYYTKLVDYKNSKEMLTEVEYQRAISVLDAGDYKSAKQLFLQLGNYKSASDFVKEADYEKALGYIDSGDYLQAFNLLGAIKGYSDVNDVLVSLQDLIYQKGVEIYRAEQPNSKDYFNAIKGYLDSQKYLDLIYLKRNYGEESYQKLLSLIGFEDAVDIIMSNNYIHYYLNGTWYNENGNYFKISKTNNGWQSKFDLPGYSGSYDISDKVYSVGSTDSFKFTFVSENEMQIYCYKNNRTYYMYRQ